MDILDTSRDDFKPNHTGEYSDVQVLDDLLDEKESDGQAYNHREEDEEFNAKYKGLTVVFKV